VIRPKQGGLLLPWRCVLSWRWAILPCVLLVSSGCSLLPTIARQPTVHNPFPQLAKVAVAPFFNHSAEPTVDGRQVALAYYAELQAIPGFEVVPMTVVDVALQTHHLELTGPAEARKLAQILEVDAVVIGAITDFSAYYPPRCALQIEWHTANPCFHPIPPGYGLPWGTPEEEEIPGSLVFEAEMALARAQMKTQTPPFTPPLHQVPPEDPPDGVIHARAELPTATHGPGGEAFASDDQGGLPPDWPDPRGFVPPGPQAACDSCRESNEPVLTHTKSYNGHDADFTAALESYVYFRDDARFGGWQSYLQRSDDFIRFCCHLHISEMLTARGGAGESRVVWRWPTGR